jgi:hypothetical protein
MLTWDKLLNHVRRKDLHDSPESMNTGGGRIELESEIWFSPDAYVVWFILI